MPGRAVQEAMNWETTRKFAARHHRLLRMATCLAILVGTLVAVESADVFERQRYTCLLCRMDVTDKSVFGMHQQELARNEFTDWYDENLPSHSHRWTKSNCTRSQTLLGSRVKWSCGPAHPIFKLPTSVEMAFAERVDRAKLQNFFGKLLSADKDQHQGAVDHACDIVFADLATKP